MPKKKIVELSPRERELFQLVWHLIHTHDSDPKLRDYHAQWADYTLKRVTQGLFEYQEMVDEVHGLFRQTFKEVGDG